jgi:hypothetical protein
MRSSLLPPRPQAGSAAPAAYRDGGRFSVSNGRPRGGNRARLTYVVRFGGPTSSRRLRRLEKPAFNHIPNVLQVTDRRAGRGFELVNGIAPKLWSRLAPRVMERLAISSGASPASSGNLFDALHDQGSAPR